MCGKLFGCAASNKKQATSIHSQSKSTESLDAGSDEVQRNKSSRKQHRVTERSSDVFLDYLRQRPLGRGVEEHHNPRAIGTWDLFTSAKLLCDTSIAV